MSAKFIRILLPLLLGVAALWLVISISSGSFATPTDFPGRYQTAFGTDKDFIVLDTATGNWEHYTISNRIYVIEGSFQSVKYDWHYMEPGQQKRRP